MMELVPTRIVAGGDALARAADGRVVFVEGALPDERVRAEITEERPDHLRARVVDVLDASAARIEPPCVYARAGCGGCSWQHIGVDAQRAFKRDILLDALARIARIDDPPLRSTITLPTIAYRTTVRTLVVEGRPAFRRRRSHDPVVVDHCLVAHRLINDLLEHGRLPDLGEVTIRAGVATGDRGATSKGYVHEIIDGVRLRISMRSFFQSRADGATVLARLVREAVGSDRVVADLYCGVGLFAALVDAPRRIIAVERDRAAAADARRNLRGRPARVVRADVATWPPEPVEVVVADPSRAGLGPGGAATVLGCDPERIVLVSCDAAAFARDVALLREGGYTLRSITPVDLFPHTPHVECVTILDR